MQAVPEIRGASPRQGSSQLVLKQLFDSRPGSCTVKAGPGPRQPKPQEEGDVLRAPGTHLEPKTSLSPDV